MTRSRLTHPQQLELLFEPFDLVPVLDDMDEEEDLWSMTPPRHIVVSAALRRPPKIKAPRSIFEAALFSAPAVRLRAARCDVQRPHRIEVVADGIVRHLAIQPQETEEWEEKERARRARQIPPKPTKQKFRMKRSKEWAT